MLLKDIDTSQTLLAGISADRRSAWESFFRIYHAPMLAFAEAVAEGAGKDFAADAVQELLVSLAQGTDRYDPARGSFRGWLMLRLRSKMLDALRAANARSRHESQAAEARALCAEAGGLSEVERAAETVFHRELAEAALREALEKAAPRTREIFRRYVLEGQPASAVAEAFGLAPNAVYQVRSRILAAAEALLEQPRGKGRR